jgi:hypothetical protein
MSRFEPLSGTGSMDPDPHQIDRLDPDPNLIDRLDPDKDPHQFADDKPKCLEYEPI